MNYRSKSHIEVKHMMKNFKDQEGSNRKYIVARLLCYNGFLYLTPHAQTTKEKLRKLDFSKI